MAADSLSSNDILTSFRTWSTEEQLALTHSLVDEMLAHE